MLPWTPPAVPSFLAPMQGVTSRVVRAAFAKVGPPDVLFTEFMRVRPGAEVGARLADGDLHDARAQEHGRPLVVQLIGRDRGPLVEAALAAQAAGAVHLNLNMGCPYGRMNVGCGGGLLERPEVLPELLRALRDVVPGSFSLKLRSGYADPEQIFSLLPLFEDVGVDFLVLHARTVVQRYEGRADHGVTARVVARTKLPVIANGDICTAAEGRRVLAQSGAAGLMVGRGALKDPLLFARLRGVAPEEPTEEELLLARQRFLRALAEACGALFSDDGQLLARLKGSVAAMELPAEDRAFKPLRKARSVAAFCEAVEGLAAG